LSCQHPFSLARTSIPVGGPASHHVVARTVSSPRPTARQHPGIRPPDPGIRTPPCLVMAGGVENFRAHSGIPRQFVQRVVPGEGVGPFVQERLDSLLLGHRIIEPDDEPMGSPAALPEDVFRQPRRPHHHGFRGRAVFSQAGQDPPECPPGRSLEKTHACAGCRPSERSQATNYRQARSPAAEERRPGEVSIVPWHENQHSATQSERKPRPLNSCQACRKSRDAAG